MYYFDILEALERYKHKSGSYPTRVILYRNGVNDAEIGNGIQQEVTQVENSFKRIENYW